MIDLAHHFGTTAVAEGIENADDLRAIHDMGCDIGQGFLLAPPMPKSEFIDLVGKRATEKAAKAPTAETAAQTAPG